MAIVSYVTICPLKNPNRTSQMSQKLNILCCNPNGGAFLYITRGWEAAFKALGHQFQRWDGTDTQLKKFKPDIYLGCSGWRQNFPQWARNTFKTKIGIHVNPWGTTKLVPKPGEPNINEAQGAIDWTRTQKPDFLYCYAIEPDIKTMWNKWTTIAPVIPMPTGGNAIGHVPVAKNPKFVCDVGFVGGRWAYKAMNIDKYLTPVVARTNAQVYGWGGWPKGPKFRGPIIDEEVNKLFSSAKICPSLVEPHTSRYGIDIPERMFKIPLGGGFTICDPCAGIGRYVSPDIFPLAQDPGHYAQLVDFYLKNDAKREELRKEQRKAILKDHTYFSRIQGFLKVSGYPEEAGEAQKKVEQLLNAVV
jgi:hypothetical protein